MIKLLCFPLITVLAAGFIPEPTTASAAEETSIKWDSGFVNITQAPRIADARLRGRKEVHGATRPCLDPAEVFFEFQARSTGTWTDSSNVAVLKARPLDIFEVLIDCPKLFINITGVRYGPA